jgi:uncharacterized membrane protein YraQ (UPF0718 family)
MSCCPEDEVKAKKQRPDILLYGSISVVTLAIILHILPVSLPYISDFAAAVTNLMKVMWWGILFGLAAVGLMNKIPREYFTSIMGNGDSINGILRAALAGLLLDLCSHGILMVGSKLYERGASLAQVMTFLIASPWNSISLTLILIALVGLKWTILFIIASAIVAVITGLLYHMMVKKGKLAANPNKTEISEDFDIKADAKEKLKSFKLNKKFFTDIILGGWHDGKMVIRWLFFGTILAALIQAFVPNEIMISYFGPTFAGLLLTLLATTIIEVCSEGSTPIGADLITRAGAPGNGFAFLMAGVSTDYTEILVIREFAKSLKVALLMPMMTVPQILFIGHIMNSF